MLIHCPGLEWKINSYPVFSIGAGSRNPGVRGTDKRLGFTQRT